MLERIAATCQRLALKPGPAGALRRGRTALGGCGKTRHCVSGGLRKAPERAARGRAGANQDGQLGVGGTADVSEPQVLQVRRRALCQARSMVPLWRCGRVCRHGERERGRAWGATGAAGPPRLPLAPATCLRPLCVSALDSVIPGDPNTAAASGAGRGLAPQSCRPPARGRRCKRPPRAPCASLRPYPLCGPGPPPGAYPCDADQGRTRRKAVRRAGRRASAPLTGAPPPHAAGGAALGGAEHRRRARGGRERRRRVLRLGPQRPRAAGRAGQRRGAARARAHRDPARLGRARDRVRVRPRP